MKQTTLGEDFARRPQRPMKAEIHHSSHGFTCWITMDTQLIAFFVGGSWARKIVYSLNYEQLYSAHRTPAQALEEIWLIVHTYVTWEVNTKTA